MPLLIPMDLFSDIGGFFDKMMTPLYWVISGILVGAHWLWSHVLPSGSGVTWALSIMTLTAVVRTAMIPLFVKTIQSSRNMQLIQPKIQELQKKYGSDRQKLSQEQMKLYKEEGVNPMASCLPLLIQMPIFISLYSVLNGAASSGIPNSPVQPKGYWLTSNPALMASLRDADLFGAKLSGTFLKMEQGFGATQILAIFLMLAMTVTLYYTQLEMMRKNMTPEALTGPFAQQQKIMLYAFPIMNIFFGLMIPVGVLIYWFFSNIWTFVQQSLLIRNSPSPNTPAYIDWEERMIAKGKDPRKIEAERLAKRNGKRKQAATTTSAAGVQRQARGAKAEDVVDTTQAETTVESGTETEASRKVTRQQPQRQTRAVRRKK